MKTRKEIVERYHELYNKMVSGKDPKNMMVFGESEKYMFELLAESHPELAENWLSHLEAVCWNNYLSETEASNIAMSMKNIDGTSGFHWTCDVFSRAVESLGGILEESPYYNSYALCVVANMIYSDMSDSIAEDMGYKTIMEVPNEKMALSCYKKAVSFLKDKDDVFKVRKYFKQTMYGKS